MTVDDPASVRLDQWFKWLVIAGILLLLLSYGRFLLLPLVVGFLIFTVLSAAIDRVWSLQFGPLRPPYWLAAALGLTAISLGMFAIYSILSGELLLVIAEWPNILERLRSVTESLATWLGEDLTKSILVAYGDFNVGAGLRSLVTPAGYAISTIIVIALYVAFLFVESSHFPEKISRLFPDEERSRAVLAVARQIIASIHRYLLLKTLISAGNTALVYILMKAVGLEFAEIWALLTFLLNFIPNIGSIAATVVPSLFAILQFQDWQPVLLLTGGLAGIHFVIGHAIDPMIMGRTLNLSSFVIILSLTFWATVWGIAGMFLAVPLMVMIMIICSKVPSLRSVAILLSSDGRLAGEDPGSGDDSSSPS
jgi:predicted PurR-regulated permease PerM